MAGREYSSSDDSDGKRQSDVHCRDRLEMFYHSTVILWGCSTLSLYVSVRCVSKRVRVQLKLQDYENGDYENVDVLSGFLMFICGTLTLV